MSVLYTLADLANFTNNIHDATEQNTGFLHGVIVFYLVMTAITAVCLICFGIYKHVGGWGAFLDEPVLFLLVIASLFWPIWLIVVLMVRSQSKQIKAAVATTWIKREPRPAATQAATRATPQYRPRNNGTVRCSECCRTLGQHDLGYVWRGGTVCRNCRKSLAVLDA